MKDIFAEFHIGKFDYRGSGRRNCWLVLVVDLVHERKGDEHILFLPKFYTKRSRLNIRCVVRNAPCNKNLEWVEFSNIWKHSRGAEMMALLDKSYVYKGLLHLSIKYPNNEYTTIEKDDVEWLERMYKEEAYVVEI